MGSIISAIEDKIREHGSLENYKEHLSKTAFIPESTARPNSVSTNPYPTFRDSFGNEVWDGSTIRIIEHACAERFNNTTALVKWVNEVGRYEYLPHVDRDTAARAFDLVTSFVVI
jgi:hypothetical protein